MVGRVAAAALVLLVIVGWAFNHRTQIGEWRERRKLAKAAKAPELPEAE